MNKRKIAIFVEGQAEYIFVRDFLNAWYGYDTNTLGVECYEFRSSRANDIPYPVGSRNSEYFYQIYNVGNDRSVLSKMLKEAGRLKNAGFHLVIGLRDMFGDDYHKEVKSRSIDQEVSQRFIDGYRKTIIDSCYRDILRFHFAIMEVEAWFLGMYRFLTTIDESLTPDLIMREIGLDVTADSEVIYYHPAKVIDDIYKLAGKQYGKHESDVQKITASLSKEDYLNLMNSNKCRSFGDFANDVLCDL